MWRRVVLDYLVYLVVRLVICFAQAIRVETGQRLARGLAWVIGDLLGIRRSVVDENLRHAFPGLSEDQRRQVARRMWEHLFLDRKSVV